MTRHDANDVATASSSSAAAVRHRQLCYHLTATNWNQDSVASLKAEVTPVTSSAQC